MPDGPWNWEEESESKISEALKIMWLKILQNEKDLQDLKNRFNSLIGDGK